MGLEACAAWMRRQLRQNRSGWALAAFSLAVLLAAGMLTFRTRPPAMHPTRSMVAGPAPLDGQVVETTPPFFRWEAVAGAALYQLQVSRSGTFPGAATRSYGGLPRTVHVPSEPLPPGRWYWRAGPMKAGETVFGPARSFVIPPGTPRFPFPDWDEAIARVPRQRPRLFFPGARLIHFRALAQGELKPALERMAAACRSELGRPLPAEPGRRPAGADFGPWAVGVIEATRPAMDLMEDCALVYLLTGDVQLGEEARRRLLHFFSWDPEGPTGFLAYDEPGLWMMMRGVRTYDWIRDLCSPAERVRVENHMKKRAGQFFRRLRQLPFETRPFDSHAGRLPGFLGECALSFIHEWPEARPWLEYATLLYYTSWPAWGGSDGGWQEGPHYWNDYIRFALHYVIALREATGMDLTVKPFFRQTPYYAFYTAPPYRQHSPFGDGQVESPTDLGPVMYAFSTLLQDPLLRWYAAEAGTAAGAELLTLAAYDPRLKALPPSRLPSGRSFPSVGLASFHSALGDREQDICFLLRSSPYGSVSHGHADQNAFVIEAFGRGLAIATGYYPWYGSPHHDRWSRSTRAVNSILVDGRGQAQRHPEAAGRLMAFETAEAYGYAAAEAAPAYLGRLQRFYRQVLHLRPGIFVISDELVAARPACFQWLLHTPHPLRIEAAARQLHTVNPPAAMRVHLLQPEVLTFSQTDRYFPEPETSPDTWSNTWHLTAETARPALRQRFLAVVLVWRQGQEAQLPQVEYLSGRGASGARFVYPGGDEEVAAFRDSPGGGPVSCGGIVSEARVFAVRTDRDGRRLRQFSFAGD